MPKIIADVRSVTTGDTGLNADVDVNVVQDSLNAIIDDDFSVQVSLPYDVGHAGYYPLIASAVASETNTRAGSLVASRFNVTLPGWNSLRIANLQTTYIQDDFITPDGDYLWRASTGGNYSGGSTSHLEGDRDHPGQLSLTTAATTSRIRGVELSDYIIMGNFDAMSFVFQLPTTVTNKDFRVGLVTSSYGSIITLRNSSGVIQIDRNGTLTSTGISYAANRWYRASFARETATGVYVFVEDEFGSSAEILSTGAAFSGAFTLPQFQVSTLAATAQTGVIDYADFRLKVSRE